MTRIRLHWFDGYVTEYPDAPDEDTQWVSLDWKAGLIVLHATGGVLHYFDDAQDRDPDGFAIFRERPRAQIDFRFAASAGPRLPVEECFDYVAVVPAAGGELDWRARSRESTNQRRLVGKSPYVRIEAAGLLKGGGPLSTGCDLIRPEVRAKRVVLTASDRTDATATAVSFHLDQGLVEVFREGDVINLTRSQRGGLGVSLIRGNELIVALGVVTAVPLASDLKATVRREAVLRYARLDSHTAPWQHPVQFTTVDAVPRKPKGFKIRVWCAPLPPPQDTDECVSIVRTGRCPELATFASTLLLATSDALQVTP